MMGPPWDTYIPRLAGVAPGKSGGSGLVDMGSIARTMAWIHEHCKDSPAATSCASVSM